MFDLLVSVTLFVGRFDMRMMQVRSLHNFDFSGINVICLLLIDVVLVWLCGMQFIKILIFQSFSWFTSLT